MNRLVETIWRNKLLRNKFLIVLVFFVVWIFLFDQNSLISQIGSQKRVNKLKADKEFYIKKIKKDSVKLEKLKNNPENLEKFARENYYMKKSDEDVYVIVKEDE